MSDIIIRKAKKDYVCDVCGHIIKTGEEYLDKVILHDGKVVRHERYHDECPCEDKVVKLFKETAASGFRLPVSKKSDGIKYLVVGFIKDCVVLSDWDNIDTDYISYDAFFEGFIYE